MTQGTSNNRISRWHDRLALLLGGVVPLTAVPLASNRATWWLLWTAILAAIAILHLLRTFLVSGTYRARFLDYRWLLGLGLVVPLWALVQALPVAPWLPEDLLGMRPGLEALRGPTISVQPEVALSGLLRYLGYILLIILVLETASRRDRVLRLGYIVYAGVCLQAIWALVALKLLGDFSLWGTKTAYLGSATGTFVNRNSLATFLGFGLVLGIGLLAERDRRGAIRASRRATWLGRVGLGDMLVLVGMVFLFLALILSQSRLGLAASITGALVTLQLVRSAQTASVPRRLAEALVLLALLFVAVAVVAAGGGVVERLLFVGSESVDRLAIYAQTLHMIALRPLTGFGMDSFGSAFEAFRAPPLLAPVTFDLAHNSYLMLWSEFGLVFGSAPILALSAIAVILWRRRRAEDGFPGMAAAGLGALVLGAIHSLGDFSLEIPANVYLLMVLLGLGLGRASQRLRKSTPPAVSPADTPEAKVFG